MSSYVSFAKQVSSAFKNEKPRSSITEWVEILTSKSYEDEAYDGIPEIVDSINLQGTGPTEASRAIRKKLKHGDPHQQYRALVILKALVENCGHKFQTTFADGQLTDAIKHLASDPATDKKVKKKLMTVLASWQNQFASDPSMSYVANLYKQYKPVDRHTLDAPARDPHVDEELERRRREKEEAKRRARTEKEEAREAARKEEEEARKKKAVDRARSKNKTKRAPFDLNKEKPQVLTSVANASQASSNLVNAITLVNLETDSLQENERVQECLVKAKQARRPIVRYIQLVEDEELIGTLIETNDRIIAAMEMYDKLSSPHPAEVSDITAGLAAANISMPDSEVTKLQAQQKAAVERVVRERGTFSRANGKQASPYVHPDLEELNFGSLGADQKNLPPPLNPSGSARSDAYGDRGSLSDFSDYQSSDEETHNRKSPSREKEWRGYVDVSDNSGEEEGGPSRSTLLHSKSHNADDPFADPFAD